MLVWVVLRCLLALLLAHNVTGPSCRGTRRLQLTSKTELNVSGCYRHKEKTVGTCLCFEMRPGFVHLTGKDNKTLYKHVSTLDGYHVQILQHYFLR